MGDIRWGSMLTLGAGARKSRLRGVVVSLALLNRSFDAQTISVTAQSEPKRVEIAAYRDHLSNLLKLVERCEEIISTDACAPSRVGPDDQVSTPFGDRRVDYGWLREVLQEASDAALDKTPQHARTQAASRLREAGERLVQDASFESGISPRPGDLSRERRTLSSILAKGDFSAVKQPGLFERVRDMFLEWLSNHLQRFGRSGWTNLMTSLLLIAIVGMACAALAWWFTRQVLRGNLSLPSAGLRHPEAPSARNWERWLLEARSHAEEGQWREAIHDVYWSAISRLESGGLWPADRARTPREYLQLLANTSPFREDLARLTGEFERFWYGGWPAGQQDFENACQFLDELAAK
jgi:hypothetical protein